MSVTLELGTAIGFVIALIGAFWTMARLMFAQFERRQDERFSALTQTLTLQKQELDEHMRKQDSVMAEIRRVEHATLSESRRLEARFNEAQLDALQRFQTRVEATDQHKQILDAIRALAERIDRIHGKEKTQ